MLTEEEMKDAVDYYADWVKDKFHLRNNEGSTEVHTPFMDRHNDGIVMYIKKNEDGTLHLTDDGDTLDGLWMCGKEPVTDEEKAAIEVICNSCEIKLENGELSMTINPDQFPWGVTEMASAVLQIGSMR